ncbi:beta-N-acetylhexosaminidase [Pseudooceanicola sp. 502str34]
MSNFGATILDAEGLRLTEPEKRFFRDVRPFGFILFARNIDTPDQVRALTDEIRQAVGHDAPIMIDQEGGRVQRLRAPHWREWLPPLDFVERAGENADSAMLLRYRIIAAELRALGIDANCAPMVDVARAETHDFLRNRCYGDTPDRVADLGRAAAEGLLQGGVLPVVKHIPGHGRAMADSHFDLPHVTVPLDELDSVDFAPFRELRDLPMGMTAHIVYDAIDDRPATLSPDVIGVIRGQIGFDNLLMTDDISMKALSGTLPDITRDSLNAGCDVVLLCNATLADRARVAGAAGEMTPMAQLRAERALAARKTPAEVDIAALDAKLDKLFATSGA